MDKIYSRRRIDLNLLKIPNKGNGGKNLKSMDKKKIKKISNIIIVMIVALITSKLVLNSITPIINKQSQIMCKSIATKICNEQATAVMSKYKYDDVTIINKDSSGNIAMISANIITVNEIISDVTVKIQEQLNNTKNTSFNLKLGSFTGSKILARKRTRYSNKNVYNREPRYKPKIRIHITRNKPSSTQNLSRNKM